MHRTALLLLPLATACFGTGPVTLRPGTDMALPRDRGAAGTAGALVRPLVCGRERGDDLSPTPPRGDPCRARDDSLGPRGAPSKRPPALKHRLNARVAFTRDTLGSHMALSRRLSSDAEPNMDAMVFAGLASAAAGIAAGAYMGASMEDCTDDEWFCGVVGGVIGGSVGATVAIPLGIHGASRRASLGAKLLGSIVTGAVAWVLAEPTGGISLLAAPLVQIGVNINQEAEASRRLAEGR